VVELAAPGAVDSADRLERVPLAPADQRFRHPLPLDGPRRPAHARRRGPAAQRARPSSAAARCDGVRVRRCPLSGVIEGGWEFVVAAYAVTAATLATYATSVFLRYRTERRRMP